MTAPISITLDKNVIDAVDRDVQEEHRLTRSRLINNILRDYYKIGEKKGDDNGNN